jgi:hypothetical protein
LYLKSILAMNFLPFFCHPEHPQPPISGSGI